MTRATSSEIAKERTAARRAELRQQLQAQVDAARLVIRQASLEERERYGIRLDDATPAGDGRDA